MVVERKRWRINYAWRQREQVFLCLSNLSHPPTTPLLEFHRPQNIAVFSPLYQGNPTSVHGKNVKRNALSHQKPLIISAPNQSLSSSLTIFVVAPKNYISKLLCATQSLPLSVIMGKNGWKQNSQLGGGRTSWNLFLGPRPLYLHIGITLLFMAVLPNWFSPSFLPAARGSNSKLVTGSQKIPSPYPGIDVQFCSWFCLSMPSDTSPAWELLLKLKKDWRTKVLWMWLFPFHFYEKETF